MSGDNPATNPSDSTYVYKGHPSSAKSGRLQRWRQFLLVSRTGWRAVFVAVGGRGKCPAPISGYPPHDPVATLRQTGREASGRRRRPSPSTAPDPGSLSPAATWDLCQRPDRVNMTSAFGVDCGASTGRQDWDETGAETACGLKKGLSERQGGGGGSSGAQIHLKGVGDVGSSDLCSIK